MRERVGAAKSWERQAEHQAKAGDIMGWAGAGQPNQIQASLFLVEFVCGRSRQGKTRMSSGEARQQRLSLQEAGRRSTAASKSKKRFSASVHHGRDLRHRKHRARAFLFGSNESPAIGSGMRGLIHKAGRVGQLAHRRQAHGQTSASVSSTREGRCEHAMQRNPHCSRHK